jgi:hypothetical protein
MHPVLKLNTLISGPVKTMKNSEKEKSYYEAVSPSTTQDSEFSEQIPDSIAGVHLNFVLQR